MTTIDTRPPIAKTLARFLSHAQACALYECTKGEEGEYFVKLVDDLARKLETMPKSYEQDGLGEHATAHLHYFKGSMDWYITERDMTDRQLQAFGLADFGDGGELGYISIEELIANGVELDLYWTPKTLAAIRKEKQS